LQGLGQRTRTNPLPINRLQRSGVSGRNDIRHRLYTNAYAISTKLSFCRFNVELGSQPKASSGYMSSEVTSKQLCSCRHGAILNHKSRSLWAQYAVHIKYGHETQKSFYITTCSHISDVGTNDVNSCRNRGEKHQRSIVAPSLRYGQKPNYLLPLKERSKCRTANDSVRKKQKKEGR
jgi:hypothetical protein